VAGRQIVVTGLTLGPGQTLTLTYGGSAPVAPDTPGPSTFASSERSGAGTTLTALVAGSPLVTVTAGSITLIVIVVIIGVLLAVVAAVLVVRRFLRRHGPGPGSGVRAAAHSGPARSVAVQRVDAKMTVAVHIEPHAGSATTTVESVER
jgi:hypothetical protein